MKDSNTMALWSLGFWVVAAGLMTFILWRVRWEMGVVFIALLCGFCGAACYSVMKDAERKEKETEKESGSKK